MYQSIDSVKVHDQFPNVIEVRDVNGAIRLYLDQDGTMIAGRVYRVSSPDQTYAVALFLPFMDGFPIVLNVHSNVLKGEQQ